MKDILLNRTKAYNVVALVDFIVSVGEEYFTLRILNHAHGRHSQTKRLYDKLCSKMIDFNISDLKQINETTYAIPSMTTKNVIYFIDTENGACTCKMGHAGSFCKHQAWIHKHVKAQLPNSPAITLEEQHELAVLALGIDKCPKPTFFLGLKESLPNSSEIVSETLNQTVNNSKYCENNECITKETTTSNEISSVPQNIDTYTQIRDTDDIINSNISVVQSEWSRLQDMIPTLPEPILNKLGYRLKKITNSSQFASFMYSLSIKSSNINKRRGQIKVQPTSISRRKEGITRGSRRINSGKRPNNQSLNTNQKRPHKLSYNIAKNQLNAKSHGKNH